MKNHLTLILILFLVGCSGNKSQESLIYDEFIESYYKAYQQTRLPIEPIRKLGDTVKFDDPFHLAKLVDNNFLEYDSVISQILPIGTELIITKIDTGLFELQTINNPNIKGVIVENDLNKVTRQGKWYLDKIVNFHYELRKNIKTHVDSVKIKYNLTDSSFNRILVNEYHRRTGADIMTIKY